MGLLYEGGILQTPEVGVGDEVDDAVMIGVTEVVVDGFGGLYPFQPSQSPLLHVPLGHFTPQYLV